MIHLHGLDWRAPQSGDAQALVRALDDPRCAGVLGRPLSQAIPARFRQAREEGDSLLLVVVQAGMPAGYIGVMRCLDELGELEMLTFLAPVLWGEHSGEDKMRGAASAAKRLQWEMGRMLGYPRLLAYVREDNLRSLRSLQHYWPEARARTEGEYLRFSLTQPPGGLAPLQPGRRAALRAQLEGQPGWKALQREERALSWEDERDQH